MTASLLTPDPRHMDSDPIVQLAIIVESDMVWHAEADNTVEVERLGGYMDRLVQIAEHFYSEDSQTLHAIRLLRDRGKAQRPVDAVIGD